MIRQIDRNILEFFTIGLKRTKWLLDAELAGLKVSLPDETHTVKSAPLAADSVELSETSKDEDALVEEDEENIEEEESSSQENEPEQEFKNGQPEEEPKDASTLLDVRVNWTDLSQNIATLTATLLSLSIRCLRCSATEFTECVNGKTQTMRCKRCATGQSLKYVIAVNEVKTWLH